MYMLMYSSYRCLSVDIKQLTSKDLPYSSNVVQSFVVYLYTNAPPLSLVDQKSEYSPVLTDSELMDLAQLAKQFGLPQLVQYCNLPRGTLLQLEIKQPPSDVSEMFLHFGLEMDKVCFHIFKERDLLKEDLSLYSERKQVHMSTYVLLMTCTHLCVLYTHDIKRMCRLLASTHDQYSLIIHSLMIEKIYKQNFTITSLRVSMYVYLVNILHFAYKFYYSA